MAATEIEAAYLSKSQRRCLFTLGGGDPAAFDRFETLFVKMAPRDEGEVDVYVVNVIVFIADEGFGM